MKSLGRLCIGVVVTSVLLVGWARARPECWGGPAKDISQLPDILSQIAADQQLGAELENRSAALHRANDAKQDVTREVLAGRMTLAQAVECYRKIHENLPIPWASMRKNYQGETDQERFGRNVISWVQSEAEDRPEMQETLARLDAEFERFLTQANP
jgi:hypothetical protein